MSDYAQEGAHWYRRDGSQCYEITGKNGKVRPATLRDARELQLVPGCTGVINMASKPALTIWMQKQAIMAALTLPRMPDETEDAWLSRVLTDSKQEGRDAADKGTLIHGAVERHYRGESPSEELWPFVKATGNAIIDVCGMSEWSAEKSYSYCAGYGCKLDLHNDDWIIDFKTKEGELDGKVWDEHPMQLAAQRRASGRSWTRCAIVFIRRDKPQALFVEVPEPDLQRGWVMFDALLAYWKAKSKYESGWA